MSYLCDSCNTKVLASTADISWMRHLGWEGFTAVGDGVYVGTCPKCSAPPRYVESVGIHRRGACDDPDAEVVVQVQWSDGTYQDIGKERVIANFSTWWTVDKRPGATE